MSLVNRLYFILVVGVFWSPFDMASETVQPVPLATSRCESLLWIDANAGHLKREFPSYSLSPDRIAGNNFTLDRGLKDYFDAGNLVGFDVCENDDLVEFIAHLQKGAIWLDAGCGRQRAQTEYRQLCESRKKVIHYDRNEGERSVVPNRGVKLVGVAWRRPALSDETRLCLRAGRFENLQADLVEVARDRRNWGTMDLITSYFGIEYYVRLEESLTTVARLLKPGGRYYFYSLRTFGRFASEGDAANYMTHIRGLRFVSQWLSNEEEYPAESTFRGLLGGNVDGGRAGYFVRTMEPFELPNRWILPTP